MKRMIFLIGGIFLAIPAVWLIRNSRAATKTAPYTTVRSDGAFELRDYPELTLATTPMDDEKGSGAFGRLFGFITGKNAKEEQIPMTTPVFIDPASGKQTMSFVLPPSVVNKGAPEPSGDVHLHKMEPARYAVLRFKGSANAKNQQTPAEKLRAWLGKQNVAAESEPIFAYFDPPWTPVFLRRNEVMLKVAKETE